jgi:hypothetical protein
VKLENSHWRARLAENIAELSTYIFLVPVCFCDRSMHTPLCVQDFGGLVQTVTLLRGFEVGGLSDDITNIK